MSADPTLWAVHILGPDEYQACASRTDAVRNAMWQNIAMYGNNADPDPRYPMVQSIVEPWPFTAAAHAENLAGLEAAENGRWTGGQPLAEIAAETFGQPVAVTA